MIHHGSKEVEEDWHISGEFSINAPKHNSPENPSLDYKVQHNEAQSLLLEEVGRQRLLMKCHTALYLTGKEKGMVSGILHKLLALNICASTVICHKDQIFMEHLL